jgi:uncharacterized protein YhaN
MTIFIKNLQVKNLGPIESFQETLGQANLFFGLNETGKTYLVEFLLHSLFRQSKNWSLRSSSGKGSVEVHGLANEPITFSPEKKRKIEHYWDEDGKGLPLNMARLLVVKGGELALSAGSPGGVDRDTLKSALTSQALLDQIWESIPSTIRNAEVKKGQILGNKRGMIKTHDELLEEIHELERLLEEIEGQYSLGPTREIEKEIEITRDKLANQHQAKCHLAYQTWQQLEELNQQRDLLKTHDIQGLRDSIRDLNAIDKDLSTLEVKLGKDKKQSKHYAWLVTALEIWEGKGLDRKKRPPNYLGIAGLTGMGIGVALLILENFITMPELVWVGSGIAGISLALSLYFGTLLLKWSSQIDESAERKSIQDEYERKFNTPLHGLADLKTRKIDLQEIHISAQTTQSILDEKHNERKLRGQSIKNSFLTLTGISVPEKEWQDKLADLAKESEEIDTNILENKLQLSRLNIPEDAYSQEPAGIDYDPQIVQILTKDLQELESKLASLQADLDTLKARACERTGDEITKPWKEVLFNLQSLLEGRITEHKMVTAGLIAKIGLTEVLTKLREDEDQKIIQAINTESVSSILYQATGRYQKLDLVEDQLIVHDAFSSYALSDLSTGAREQVQLALRLGIASQICGGDPLFLILDDAFQHSDWQRREALVKSTLSLARSGWQILYLSMDDHIRDLFLKIIKPALKKDFKLFQLS